MTKLKDLWDSRRSTLTNNLVTLLLFFGIIPLAVIFLVFQYAFLAHQKEGVMHLHRESAQRAAEQISSCVTQSSACLTRLGEMMQGELNHPNLFRRLDEFLRLHPEYEQLAVFDQQGREICQASQTAEVRRPARRDCRTEPGLQQALAGEHPIVYSPSRDPSRLPHVHFFVPLKNPHTGIIGVLEASMDLQPLRAIISRAVVREEGVTLLIGADGGLILGSHETHLTPPPDLSHLPSVQALQAGETGVWEYANLQNRPVIAASALVPATGWGVVLETPHNLELGQGSRVAGFFFGLFGVTLIAAALRGLIFSQNRILGPIKALKEEVDTLSRGVFPEGLNFHGTDELSQLSRAFNHMVQHLKQTMVSRDLLAQEVHERKLVEELLRRREATLRSIFLTVPLGIGSLHRWILVEGNDCLYKLTGFGPTELRGRNLSQLFEDPQDYHHMIQQLQQTLEREETLTFETRWRRRDGEVREMLLKFAPVDRGHLTRDLVFAAMDISNLRKMERERLRMDKLESLGILAGGIAHDFNNILTVIQGNLELLGLETETPECGGHRLKEAEQACQRAQHLAKQLLTFARGGLPVKKPVPVGELLQDVVALALSGSQCAVDLVLEDEVWPVDIDEDQIHQVINNILINAVQAMPHGGLITIRASNLQVCPPTDLPLPEGRYVKLSFIDQGMGIHPKDLEKIFDPYFTTKKFGNGLGLTVAFSIVKNHQGHLAVDSQLNVGTCFHLYLPAAKSAARTSRPKVSPLPVRGQGRILVLDDEAAIRSVLSNMLHKLGYEAVCVKDGEEVLEAYRHSLHTYHKFDAVILDLTIPGGLGGKETLALLRQLDPFVRAIVSSGYEDDPIMANYAAFGFQSVIAKPYKISELSQVLNNLLNKDNTPESLEKISAR